MQTGEGWLNACSSATAPLKSLAVNQFRAAEVLAINVYVFGDLYVLPLKQTPRKAASCPPALAFLHRATSICLCFEKVVVPRPRGAGH